MDILFIDIASKIQCDAHKPPYRRNSFDHAKNNLTAVTGRLSYCPVFRSISYPTEKDLLVELDMHPMFFLPGMKYSFVYFFFLFFNVLTSLGLGDFSSLTEQEFVCGILHLRRLMPFSLTWRNNSVLLGFMALQQMTW